MSTPSKNHHGFIVTSPTGSVSLKDLPVPRHETHAKASKYGREQGKPFIVVEASKFFRTSFGKTVQALERKQALARPRLIVGAEAIIEANAARKPNALTKLLTSLKAQQSEKEFNAKVDNDTKKRYAKVDPLSRQLRETGQALDEQRQRLADKSYLAKVMIPPNPSGITRASNDDLMSLFLKQDSKMQQMIDIATRFRWDKKRVNKLVKSGTIESLLTLFRAGQLPEKCRTNKKLLTLLNK